MIVPLEYFSLRFSNKLGNNLDFAAVGKIQNTAKIFDLVSYFEKTDDIPINPNILKLVKKYYDAIWVNYEKHRNLMYTKFIQDWNWEDYSVNTLIVFNVKNTFGTNELSVVDTKYPL